MWSYSKFQKPIFNGRDNLWKRGFELLWENPIMGTGDFNRDSWHNSAVTCLVATGVVGFILWIQSLKKIIEPAMQHLDDYIVMGSLVSFFVLYAQQAVELGFISENPTLIGYILLGVMLGRVRYLQGRERWYEAYD